MLRKLLRWLGRGLAGLVGLVVVFYAEEYVRGRWAWERYLRELAARGDSLDIQKYVPPPIPDDQNMAAAPIFAGLFTETNYPSPLSQRLRMPSVKTTTGDWRTGHKVDLSVWKKAFTNDDLTQAFSKYDAVLAEIAAAAQRPQARFPVRYENGPTAELPHLFCLRELSKVLMLRALVRLEARENELAAQDLALLLRLGRSVDSEPLQISAQVHISLVSRADQVLWEGLQGRHWGEAQLAALQQEFHTVDSIKQLRFGSQGERCETTCWLQEQLKDPGRIFGSGSLHHWDRPWWSCLIPRGWVYLNCRNLDQAFVAHLLPSFDVSAQRIYPEYAATYIAHFEAARAEGHWTELIPFHYLEIIILPAFDSDLRGGAQGQTAAQQGALACALERYRLANGRLPEMLDLLVPQFIAKIPLDVMDGQPLCYRLEKDGSYKLWAIGWNQKDDGGAVAFLNPKAPEDQRILDDQKGDWVWQMPMAK
jgi:hypothetical protein